MHIQIIVSRKDISNTIKLSPQNTSKGKNKSHSEKLGQFDRTAFKQSGESLFDRHFNFDRGLKETLTYANTMKNGTATQKSQMQVLGELPKQNTESSNIIMDLSQQVAVGLFVGIGDMLETIGQVSSELLEILLTEPYIVPDINPAEEAEKRRIRKSNKQQSQGLQR